MSDEKKACIASPSGSSEAKKSSFTDEHGRVWTATATQVCGDPFIEGSAYDVAVHLVRVGFVPV